MGETETWVVVGASRGIGLEFVKQLLESGKRVIAAVRSPSGAEQLSQLIVHQPKPENCVVEQCDVTSEESIDVSLSLWPSTSWGSTILKWLTEFC